MVCPYIGSFRRSLSESKNRGHRPSMTGHLTNSVFERYAIVDEAMLQEAGERLAASSKVTRESGKVVRLER